jgi:hypothetical protein
MRGSLGGTPGSVGGQTVKSMQAIVSTLSGLSTTRKTSRSAAREDRAEATVCKYAHAGIEPTLDEALQDPVVQMMMRADRLDSAEVYQALSAARERVVGAHVPRSRGSWPSASVSSAYADRAPVLEAQ